MLTGEGIDEAEALVALYRRHKLRIATAESCTGGLVAALLTSMPGSSAVFERGFVTYSNEAKIETLGVPESYIANYGAVSAEVAVAMAVGALDHSQADVAISITGIAGPDGGSSEKPVGLVYLACGRRGTTPVPVERRFGELGRSAVRAVSVTTAFKMLTDLVSLL
jgi:nicotinamide-nucleotide amidase